MSPTDFPYHLIPAPGQDYRSLAAFEADLYAGRDFIAAGADRRLYCTIRDIPNGAKVQVRYAKLTKTTVITIDKTRRT